MKKDLEKERMIVDRISEFIIPDYLNNAELQIQENKDAKDSIIIKIGNNTWRNGVIKGDMLFGRIKTGGKAEYLQIKNRYSHIFNKLKVELTSNKTEQNEGMIRIKLSDFCGLLTAPTELFVKTLNSIYIDNISFAPFGCCSKYAECEKEGKCLHCDQLYATACQWQKYLKRTDKFE